MKRLRRFNTESQYNFEKDDFNYETVAYVDYTQEVKWMTRPNYLTFEALEDCVFTIEYYTSHNDTFPQSQRESFSYSVDNGETWVTYTTPSGGITPSTTTLLTTPTIHTGERVLWKGIGTGNAYSDPESTYIHFTSTGNFNASGNVMTLLYGDDYFNTTTLPSDYAFTGLFRSNTKLHSAENLNLPSTTLASNCYRNMFYGCTSLTAAPVLNATSLAQSCYQGMFFNCTSLTTAPVLPATTLTNGCYNYMFYGCSQLNYIKAMFTTEPRSTYTYNWVYGVASTGTFVKNSVATWTLSGSSGIPSGWTVETASS